MQTIEEYKAYTAQLEGELHDRNELLDAYKLERNLLLKDIAKMKAEIDRLERERVDQNAIIETCANELEELRKHELEWELDKAKIKELEQYKQLNIPRTKLPFT